MKVKKRRLQRLSGLSASRELRFEATWIPLQVSPGRGWGVRAKSRSKSPPSGGRYQSGILPAPTTPGLASELAPEGMGAASTVLASDLGGSWVQALDGRQHPLCRAWTQVAPSVLKPHPRPGLASALGGRLTLVERQ